MAAGVALAVAGALLALVAWDPALAATASAEDGPVEWLQAIAEAGAAALMLWRLVRRLAAGEPVALEVMLAAFLVGQVIGELDIDRRIFSTKVIKIRFFYKPAIWLPYRILAAAVVVGAPILLGLYALRRRAELWQRGVALLREPAGQVLATGVVLLALVQLLESPLGHVPRLPPSFLEEGLELVGSLWLLLAAAALRR